MDDTKRKLIQSYLEKYLISKIPNFKKNNQGYFECPFKDEHKTADEMPSCKIYSKPSVILKCFNPTHNKSYDI